MGFYTNVTISNDFWHKIAENPQKLVGGISVGMNYGIDDPIFELLHAEAARIRKAVRNKKAGKSVWA